jgi:pimeloyl-ACP methyl ester carboxylesterase
VAESGTSARLPVTVGATKEVCHGTCTYHAARMYQLTPPRHEGTVLVRGGRKLGYAEFGSVSDRTIVWFHGTPGARLQIPELARTMAESLGLRVIGVDRPGIGLSTAHLYQSISDFVPDFELLLDALGVDQFAIIGLSGGGPYALAAACALPHRVTMAGILGGVAPNVGEERIDGGLVGHLAGLRSVLPWVRGPVGRLLQTVIPRLRPIGPPALDIYARLSPEGDRIVLGREDIKAMFLDDLFSNGARGLEAPIDDLILFLRPWGFAVADISIPVRWWHGDADNIVPFEHGRHVVSLIPDAELFLRPGESHLGGLGAAEEVINKILDAWPGKVRHVV